MSVQRSNLKDTRSASARFGDLTPDERRLLAKKAGTIAVKKILVIDPTPAFARLLSSYYAPIWPEVEATPYDPVRGFPDAAFDVCDYDVIFLEHNLGRRNEDGLTWLYELRRLPHVPPVIMLNGSSDLSLSRAATDQGAWCVLEKASLNSRDVIEAILECTADRTPDATIEVTLKLPALQLSEAPDDIRELDIPNIILEPGNEERAPESARSVSHNLDIEIPGYIVERRLSAGNMGEVFLATGCDDSEQLALKVMRFGDERDDERIRRFMREYKVISEISNEHVINVYERGFGPDYAYIAMEYCVYGNLKTKLRSAISPARALSCLRQIALGLGAAHDVGLVHRDVKPANILFRDEDTLALADFGVAKKTGENENLTMTNSIVGSMYYVSPEQIADDTCGPLSDLYSTGVVLYEMLEARPPFVGSSLADIMHAHRESPIPRLRSELAAMQPLVDGLLAKCPDDRFQSAAEVIAGIDWVSDSL